MPTPTLSRPSERGNRRKEGSSKSAPSGKNSIVIGSDYSHANTSSETEALRKLKTNGELKPDVIDKILDANPRALYTP